MTSVLLPPPNRDMNVTVRDLVPALPTEPCGLAHGGEGTVMGFAV